MTKESNIKLFENKKIRTVWDEEKEDGKGKFALNAKSGMISISKRIEN